MLPELLDQITPEQKIAPPPSPPTVPVTPARAMMPSPRAVPAASIPPRDNAKPRKPDTAGAIARNKIPRTSSCGHNHLATTALATPITEVTR